MRLLRLSSIAIAGSLAFVQCAPVESSPSKDEEIVENLPGSLVVTEPARASFIENDKKWIDVRGTGATPDLRINGKPAEVAPDGSFHATIEPYVGLNMLVAEDGESRLETPFVYGHFVSADRSVPRAIAVDLGKDAIEGAAPAASLGTIVNAGLVGRDFLTELDGQTLSGSVTGVGWTFVVTGGRHDTPNVSFAAGDRGPGITAIATKIVVEGNLTVGTFGPRPVRIDVDRAVVMGASELYVDEATGTLHAAMPSPSAWLEGFRYSSGNGGFPCCLDSIMTSFLRPRVESTIRDALREQVPRLVKVTLDGLGLPKELDLSMLGMKRPLPIATRLDGGLFDSGGATLTASALFGGSFEPDEPGAKAPGWLELGRRFEPTGQRHPSLGVSFSIDAVNQLFFAAWGRGGLSFEITQPFAMKLTPMLPPILSFGREGSLRAALGEIVVQRNGEGPPVAAVSIVQDVLPSTEGDFVVLVPKGSPAISITWLGGSPGSGNNAIANAAREQIGKLLQPMKFPVPKISLDAVGPTFAGQSLGIETPSIAIDRSMGRVGASGTITIVR